VTYADGTPASWYNGNLLVHPESQYYREEVSGLKTGTTDEAGYCLLTVVRWDYDLIIGVFGCDSTPSRCEDTITLLDTYEDIFCASTEE
jgi:D-alanyl-D-alanine carboxypeptidase